MKGGGVNNRVDINQALAATHWHEDGESNYPARHLTRRADWPPNQGNAISIHGPVHLRDEFLNSIFQTNKSTHLPPPPRWWRTRPGPRPRPGWRPSIPRCPIPVSPRCSRRRRFSPRKRRTPVPLIPKPSSITITTVSLTIAVTVTATSPKIASALSARARGLRRCVRPAAPMSPSAARARCGASRPRGSIRPTAADSPGTLPAICWCGRRRCAAGTLQCRWIDGKVCLNVLGQHHSDTEVVAWDEAQLVERARVFLSVGAVLYCTVVIEQLLDGAGFAQGVPRIHGAEILLRELPAVACVGIDRAERVAGQWVAVFERVWRGIADGGQELEKRGIFPFERRVNARSTRAWRVCVSRRTT